MKKRTTAIAAALSVLACGSPFLTGCSFSFRGNTVFQNALEKQNASDFLGAISDYSKAIEIDPNYVDAYVNRGVAKSDLGDNLGAISDYSKAIEINPNYLDAYINLGVEKNKVGEMKGACFNWTKASGLGDEDATKWVKEYCQ